MTSYWTGERVRLRGTEPGDWEAFQRFDQVSEDLRSVHQLYPPRSAASYRKFFADNAEATPDKDTFGLIICSIDNGEVVGSIDIHDCNPTAGTFRFGISIGHEHQRRGYASEALVLVLGFMFGERRYQKSNSSVYDYNEPSLALHRRLGFVEEGTVRRSAFFAGRYYGEVLFGITVEEHAERYSFPPI